MGLPFNFKEGFHAKAAKKGAKIAKKLPFAHFAQDLCALCACLREALRRSEVKEFMVTGQSRVNLLHGLTTLLAIVLLLQTSGCGIYSFSGIATSATSIQVDPFYNNTDLGPANIGQDFTNKLKDYFQRNSSLNVTPENGELQIEGIVTEYRITQVAPVSSGSATDPNFAALTRLTISVKANFTDNIVTKNSFKDKTFSFYADFPNTQELSAVQESLEKKIFDQILLDIFNATVANW